MSNEIEEIEEIEETEQEGKFALIWNAIKPSEAYIENILIPTIKKVGTEVFIKKLSELAVETLTDGIGSAFSGFFDDDDDSAEVD